MCASLQSLVIGKILLETMAVQPLYLFLTYAIASSRSTEPYLTDKALASHDLFFWESPFDLPAKLQHQTNNPQM